MNKELSKEWKWDYLPNEGYAYDKTEPENVWFFIYPEIYKGVKIWVSLEEIQEVNK